MTEELQLQRCDLEVANNGQCHHTSELSADRLVVRRGQSFCLTLHFEGRSYQEGVDNLTFTVETGPEPSPETGTKARFALSADDPVGCWSAFLMNQDDASLSVALCSPPDAPVGQYQLTLETDIGSQGSRFQAGKFILLFNSWCPEDSVYLEDEKEREEYVLSQYGVIYQGSHKFINPTHWNFGQFEDGILDICLHVLNLTPKPRQDTEGNGFWRQSPVYVSRVVSSMINSNDEDHGVLLGRWKDPYDDGTNPNFWTGSVAVLRKWMESGNQQVRYGQCWVFAAVACTVLRALGIPTRVVTNFNSAHDTNRNLVIDFYYDESGKRLEGQRDSIWNYHCWVESWMTRPDLRPEYNGWQAIDPTPQERSDGIYWCGPASVNAVKEGDLSGGFDVPFIFAEVNADVVHWFQESDGSRRKYSSDPRLVGKSISTKSVGTDQRQDITHCYKYPEGSDEEREAFRKADRQLAEPEPEQASVSVRIKGSEHMDKGSDFDVSALVTNGTDGELHARLRLCARTISYNGILGAPCGFIDLQDFSLPAGTDKMVPLRILYDEYSPYLTESNLIKVVALLSEPQSDRYLMAERDVYLKNPDIRVRILGEPKQYEKLVAEVSLKNPLKTPLLDCCFTLEGAGLTLGQQVIHLPDPVAAGEEAKARLALFPQQSGLRKLVVDFESDLLKAVKGFRNVIVAPVPK
ncbi:protein-glutamine gamma-glutamyltransferase 2 [Tachyglossus aculeatus]|uniref:protein-glutamine gamma-glutamyltransferase 2 n=1 Tax=Tachyglossus aculeatus TaxID=9261 RepID=UPI0018F67639|nr:protein-glutamine gamma-glutamyltransferase 2 [Tachyglossus aculeatus]